MIQPMPKDIYKSEYDYEVPEELIAKFPPKNRVDSKLLSYSGQNFNIDSFQMISKFFHKDDLIVFNETKVFDNFTCIIHFSFHIWFIVMFVQSINRSVSRHLRSYL